LIAMSSQGIEAHVEFDFFRIWEAMKQWKETHEDHRFPIYAHMYHTHPNGCRFASNTDINAVKGWTTSLGMPIQMVIVSDIGTERYYCYKDNQVSCDYDFDVVLCEPRSIFKNKKSEHVLMAVMQGLSSLEDNPTQHELDAVTEELQHMIVV